MDDYDEQLGYDADHSDERQYCAHGTFIGSWWGPDYLCGACEMGITVEEMREAEAEAAAYRAAKREEQYERLIAVYEAHGLWGTTKAQVSNLMVELVLADVI